MADDETPDHLDYMFPMGYSAMNLYDPNLASAIEQHPSVRQLVGEIRRYAFKITPELFDEHVPLEHKAFRAGLERHIAKLNQELGDARRVLSELLTQNNAKYKAARQRMDHAFKLSVLEAVGLSNHPRRDALWTIADDLVTAKMRDQGIVHIGVDDDQIQMLAQLVRLAQLVGTLPESEPS